MTSSKPYLLQALYDWIVANRCTPYMVVDALMDGVAVPPEHVQDGRIVLNIGPQAVAGLVIDQTGLACEARFGGAARWIRAPLASIIAIYAYERGHGMMFDAKGRGMLFGPDSENPPPGDAKPALKVVK